MSIQLLLFLLLKGRSSEMQFANIALNKPAKQSSEYNSINYKTPEPARAVDGETSGNFDDLSCTHTAEGEDWHWWMVDLQANYTIQSIRIYNRLYNHDRLNNFTVEISMENPCRLSGFPRNALDADVCFARQPPVPKNGPHDFKCAKPITGRYVRFVKKSPKNSPLTLCEVEVYGTPFKGKSSERNLALKKHAEQSSTYRGVPGVKPDAALAVDGQTSGNFRHRSCTHTSANEGWHWWMVDLQANYTIQSIGIYNRENEFARLNNFTVEISMENPRNLSGFPRHALDADVCFSRQPPVLKNGPHNFKCAKPTTGRYVRFVKKSPKNSPLTLCEVEVYETPFKGDDSKCTNDLVDDNTLEDKVKNEMTTTNNVEFKRKFENYDDDKTTMENYEDEKTTMDNDADDETTMKNDPHDKSTDVKKDVDINEAKDEVNDKTMIKTRKENVDILEKWHQWNEFLDENISRASSGKRFSKCDHECC